MGRHGRPAAKLYIGCVGGGVEGGYLGVKFVRG
jgi:hypothetical protein